MSDRVAVMSAGVVEQMADSETIYDRPESAFVASFVGENNALAGKISTIEGDQALVDTPFGPIRARLSESSRGALQPNGEAFLFVRPESLSFVNGDAGSFDNKIQAHIAEEQFEGNVRHLVLKGAGDKPLTMSVINAGRGLEYHVGSEVTLGFNSDLVVALPPGPLAAE